MVLPVIGRVVAGLAGSGGKPALRLTLQYGMRRVRRRMRRVARDTEIANVRALNRSGRWARTRIRREISRLLNVPQKILSQTEIRATRRKPTYEFRLYRKEYPVRRLKGVRFRPYRGQRRESRAHAGVLRFRAYGHDVVLERVLRYQGARGVRYRLLPDDGRKGRRVHGTWLKADYAQPKKIKRGVRAQYRKNFREQMRILKERRR